MLKNLINEIKIKNNIKFKKKEIKKIIQILDEVEEIALKLKVKAISYDDLIKHNKLEDFIFHKRKVELFLAEILQYEIPNDSSELDSLIEYIFLFRKQFLHKKNDD